MRLIDWIKAKNLRLEDVAPQIGVTVSNLSKIANGHFWVNAETAGRVRDFTDGEVTLDDLHDAWRERHPEGYAEKRVAV